MRSTTLKQRLERLEAKSSADSPLIIICFAGGDDEQESGFVLIPAGQNRTFANQQELDAILAEVHGNGRADV